MDEHCKDCCCARAWEALGITDYTGKSIPEEITALRKQNAELVSALKNLLILHTREQQGLEPDMPTSQEWMDAVNEGETALNKHGNAEPETAPEPVVELNSLLSARSEKLPIAKPKAYKTVLAVVEHWHTKGQRYGVLYAVDEDDCDYRITDDNSELSADWNVVSWVYLPELT